MSSWIDVALLIFLIVVSGVFAMAEIGVVASRKARLQILSDNGDKRADTAWKLQNDPTKALSTVQVGITVIGILSGIVGQSALAKPVSQVLEGFGLSAEISASLGLLLVVVFVTYVSIVLGELVPKRLAQGNPEKTACFLAPTLNLLSILMGPFVKLLSVSTDLTLKLMGAGKLQEAPVTEEEIHAILEEGSESGVIEENERDMVRNIFRLDDRQVGSVMIPRVDIIWIDLEDSDESNLKKLLQSNRSRLIVGKGSLDDVKGICSTRQLLGELVSGGKANFEHNLIPVSYVPESLSVMELLEQFKLNDSPMALVVDEYGSVVGLVTPRDILEVIAGEFKPETTDDAWVLERQDGSLFLDGIIPIPELKDQLKIKEVPQEEEGRYNTLSGMMMVLLQRLPKVSDVVEWAGWRLEVTKMDGRRIDKVLASPLGEETPESPKPVPEENSSRPSL